MVNHLNPCRWRDNRQQVIFIIFMVRCNNIIYPVIFPSRILHTILKVFPLLSKRLFDILLRYGKNRHYPKNIIHDNIEPPCIMRFFTNNKKISVTEAAVIYAPALISFTFLNSSMEILHPLRLRTISRITLVSISSYICSYFLYIVPFPM